MSTLPEAGIRVEPRREGPAAVLSVTGDVDAASAHVLRDLLLATIDDGPQIVVVDLTQVGYIDSVGLGTLVVSLKRAGEQQTRLRLVVTSPPIEKIFKITGLLTAFEIYHDLHSATRS